VPNKKKLLSMVYIWSKNVRWQLDGKIQLCRLCDKNNVACQLISGRNNRFLFAGAGYMRKYLYAKFQKTTSKNGLKLYLSERKKIVLSKALIFSPFLSEC